MIQSHSEIREGNPAIKRERFGCQPVFIGRIQTKKWMPHNRLNGIHILTDALFELVCKVIQRF